MIVTAGGQDHLGGLKQLNSDYLIGQRKLADLFKHLFISGLKNLIIHEDLALPNRLKINRRYQKWLGKIEDQQWICSVQKPLKDIFQLVGYVGRYTKRACISEYKLISIDNDHISFTANDYKNSKRRERPKQKIIKLHFVQFLDRILQHVPTKRYRMVRYSGMYNSHYLKKQNEKYNQHNIQNLNQQELEIYNFKVYRNFVTEKGEPDPLICPNCNIPLQFYEITFTKHRFNIDDS